MKRQILQQLQVWRQAKNRNPLILKGVRQCGKTFTLLEFAKTQFPGCHYINFEKQPELHAAFAGDLTPQNILQQLSFLLDVDINPKTELLIFDEIQACPRALTSLKYFAEEMPDLAVASAGSLLGLELNPASFPVGKVDFMSLYPMSFREFLWALDDNRSVEYLDALDRQTQISTVIHQHLWDRLKWYFITGGLPKVVDTFVQAKNNLYVAFNNVRKKQEDLIEAYYADIAKHAGKVNAMHIERVFKSVPTQLAKNQNSTAPRFQFAHIIPGVDRYQRLVGAVDWLKKAGLVIPVPIVGHIEMPLNAFTKEPLFKLYCFDVGILGAMNKLPPKVILDFDFGTYKGYFAENFIAEQLQMQKIDGLFCWQKNRAEIEFVTPFDDKIIPIEVKAGHITRAKSLEKYRALYKPAYSILMNANALSEDAKNKILFLQLYAANWLPL